MPDHESYPFVALRERIAQLAAEGRHTEREAACSQRAELIMRGPQGFNPQRRLLERPAPRLRYRVIEAS